MDYPVLLWADTVRSVIYRMIFTIWERVDSTQVVADRDDTPPKGR